MGTLLIADDGTQLVGHEGYVAYLLDQPVTLAGPSGGPSSTYRGWTGQPVPATHYLDEAQSDALMDQWYSQHANPLRGQRARLQPVITADGEVRDAEGRRVRAIAAARAQGASWSEIGSALGVSKQAAQQRYS
jgi:hypothetical protein